VVAARRCLRTRIVFSSSCLKQASHESETTPLSLERSILVQQTAARKLVIFTSTYLPAVSLMPATSAPCEFAHADSNGCANKSCTHREQSDHRLEGRGAGIGWSNERGGGADKVGGEGQASERLTTETLVHIDMRGWTHDCTCVIASVYASHASTSAVGRSLGVGCIMDAIRSARPFDTPGSGGACPLRSRTNSSPCAANLLCEPSSAPRAVICISSRHSVSSGAGASRGSER
jgi:hypothetical protein